MFTKTPLRYLFIFILIVWSTPQIAHTELEVARRHNNTVPKNPLDIYLLPAEHPLQPFMEALFHDPLMFRSAENLTQAGFVVKRGHRHLMVGAHPAIPDYLIKKFPDNQSQTIQLKNFITRIDGSRIVRETIKKYNCQYLVVPQKWLYQLPKSFNGKTGTRSYVLIVENMDICSREENLALYYHMDREILTELCIVLHALNGCDAFPRNQPFTRSGKIAFVDTEHVGGMKGHFLKHIVPALNPELQTYAVALWAKLEDESKAHKRKH